MSSFRQILEHTYRLKELSIALSIRSWRVYRLERLLDDVRPDFGSLERFEFAHYTGTIDISRTWFKYGLPIPLTHLNILGGHLNSRTLAQFPLEELIIHSDGTLDLLTNDWHAVLTELAPTLRMLYVSTASFNVNFATSQVIELPRLQVLDIPILLVIIFPMTCFSLMIRMPVDCDVRLRAPSHPLYNPADILNAHLGHLPVHHGYRICHRQDAFTLAPISGPGQLHIMGHLPVLSSFANDINPAVRAAVQELEIESLRAFSDMEYIWLAHAFPNANTINLGVQ
jgi:hypothetical protein